MPSRIVCIIGGTGSLGHSLTENLLKTDVEEIRIFSRGEDLQHKMRIEFPDERVNLITGDVRDYNRLLESTRQVDTIINAAALKQVADCERHPFEAVKTNILGAYNVKQVAIVNEVENVVSISTDKAAKPVSAYGMTKGLQEKIMTTSEVESRKTKFTVARFGNYINSRGSVIPLFQSRVANKMPLYVTDFRMTRFMILLSDAVKTIFKILLEAKGNETFVLKKPACLIKDLAEVIADERVEVLEGKIRPGEKLHEILVQEDEMRRAVETEEHYIIYPSGTEGAPKLKKQLVEYSSEDERRLTNNEIRNLLAKSYGETI